MHEVNVTERAIYLEMVERAFFTLCIFYYEREEKRRRERGSEGRRKGRREGRREGEREGG